MNEPVQETQLLAFIEIPKGSRNKYEYDEGLDRVVFDRFLSGSTVYTEANATTTVKAATISLDGDTVSIRSRVGRTELDARITDRITPGHVFTTFHFPETRTNLLIGQSADVNTSCPEYKVVAVDVRPMGEEPAFTLQLETVA